MFLDLILAKYEEENKKHQKVIYTAALETLYMLYASKNKDVEKYIEIIEKEEIFGSKSELVKRKKMIEKRIDIMFGASLILENKYECISNLLIKENYKNMLDIACGYTPRAYFAAKNNISYNGIDVSGVVETMQPLTEKLIGDRADIIYTCGGILNSELLLSISECMEGKIFISTEGILNNYTVNEMKNIINTMKEILIKHGGAWYTADFETRCDIITAIKFGCEESFFGNLATDVPIVECQDYFVNEIKDNTERELFFNENGMIVEKIHLYSDEIQLDLLCGLNEEKKKKIIDELYNNYIWKITVK